MRTELLDGYTIHELLARQGRLSLPFALAVATEAAFGLHAVHEAQIIHRDVKPSNLFYTRGRGLKVIDLSLAKDFPEGIETTAGRKIGLGTPAYAAPEQLEGIVRPDVRFDVHGLGMTVWEMLAGRNPNADILHDMAALLERQIAVMPPLLADVARLPPQVDVVVRRAIAKDPAKRYGSMMEMARALTDLSAWAAAEARARRVVIVVLPGEPALPGDTNTWRDYRPPEPTPVHDAPPSMPTARVILAATAPLPADVPGGLAGTLPLDDASLGTGTVRTARGTALLPAEPSRPVATVPARASEPTAMRPATAPMLRETPGAIARSQPSAPVSPQPRRTRWPAVIVAVVVVSLSSIAGVTWLLGRGRVPARPAPVATGATSWPPPTPPDAPSAAAPPPEVPAVSSPSSAPASPGAPRRAATPAKRSPPPPTVAAAPSPDPPPATPAPTHRAPIGLEQ
jgi:serine/threonine-protein kinase